MSHTRASDAGFTLIEAVVAFFIVVVMILGLTATLRLAMRNQLDIRLHQQASALATEGVEFARSLAWDEVALTAAPSPSDPHIAGSSLAAGAFELESAEPLVIDAFAGAIDPVGPTETINNQVFTITNYVTNPSTDLRRVVVLIQWETASGIQEQSAVTLISRLGA